MPSLSDFSSPLSLPLQCSVCCLLSPHYVLLSCTSHRLDNSSSSSSIYQLIPYLSSLVPSGPSRSSCLGTTAANVLTPHYLIGRFCFCLDILVHRRSALNSRRERLATLGLTPVGTAIP